MLPEQLYIADRNFCTTEFLTSMIHRNIAFIIREHKSLPWVEEMTNDLQRIEPEFIASVSNGQIFEQAIFLRSLDGNPLKIRRIIVKLKEKTVDGDDEIIILTNVPRERADAVKIAELYRNRWTIEKLFGTIKRTLDAELPSLGTPKVSVAR
jgi:IS4 transposase